MLHLQSQIKSVPSPQQKGGGATKGPGGAAAEGAGARLGGRDLACEGGGQKWMFADKLAEHAKAKQGSIKARPKAKQPKEEQSTVNRAQIKASASDPPLAEAMQQDEAVAPKKGRGGRGWLEGQRRREEEAREKEVRVVQETVRDRWS